jgi:hypothetical protein
MGSENLYLSSTPPASVGELFIKIQYFLIVFYSSETRQMLV